MTLEKLIQKENCCLLKSRTKTEAFHELFDLVEGCNIVDNLEELKKEIFYREQIMSTGIGQGIGIPHVRFDGIDDPRVFIGFSANGLEDYESIDGEAVKVVIMILVGAEQHKEYLRILSLIVSRLKDGSLISSLNEKSTVQDVYSLMTGDSA